MEVTMRNVLSVLRWVALGLIVLFGIPWLVLAIKGGQFSPDSATNPLSGISTWAEAQNANDPIWDARISSFWWGTLGCLTALVLGGVWIKINDGIRRRRRASIKPRPVKDEKKLRA
ncbi:MAG: hypothetical protein A2677_00520 [Candidatus Komeilibacteria bacterium RIFCSPHIGHO2_01_FULL_52_14]|uniref:Uncharacterized protein n=1 Tax=Candidatus Komeilibacteria bacterium RIFCSPHIGHO2_01_FULL_52_14 TaxID=1798549 RepID=A0A1G2BLN6_9BACT|nr:MAG: hypothetical protein A2677_00520 [Candidatus Komeilibacteria bacterium RIFCSPHIGHO2_01_FULL_52_14]